MKINEVVMIRERFQKIQRSPDCPGVIQRLQLGQVRKDTIRARDAFRDTCYEVSLDMGRMVLRRIVWEEKRGNRRFAGIQQVWQEE